jgi:hypothetical protein
MSTTPEPEEKEEEKETNRARIEKQYKEHRALQGDPVPEDTGREGTSPENPEYLPENLNKQAPERCHRQKQLRPEGSPEK